MSTTDTDTGQAKEPAAAKRHVGVSADGELGAAGSQLSTAPVETAVPGSFGGMRAPGVVGGWRGPGVSSSAGSAGSGGS